MNCFSTFFRNREGTSSLMFGLISLPLMSAVGAMSDYTTAADARTKLQAALDATGLKLSRITNTLDDAQLQSQGNALVRTLMAARHDVSLSTVVVTRANQRIDVSAQGSVTARFAGLFGSGRTAIRATSQTAWGVRKLEIALVLDNTGSMSSSGKMTALKTAATNFINTLEAVAYEPDSVKISIVPFNTTVKVGTAYSNASWLTKNYLNASPNPYPRTSNPANWDGCVMDRAKPYDVNDSAAVPGTLATLYPATMCPVAGLAAIMPLSTNFAALRTHIGTMYPTGNTNVTIGVAWGQAVLSDQNPMSGGVAYGDPNVDKVMIVLTDGDNTQNRFGDSLTVMNQQTQAACTDAKGKGIRLYTIRVINGNGTLLRDCATSPSMYYNVTDASQLNPVFQEIAESIQSIRLTN
jgi:Flp pilus assembly protein TadG